MAPTILKPGKNIEVTCSGNVIRFTVTGPVDLEDAKRCGVLSHGFLDRGEAEYFLIDLNVSLNDFLESTSPIRKILVNVLKDPKLKKTAFITRNTSMKTFVSFVVSAAGEKDLKSFKTVEEAEEWLKEA